MECGFGSYRMSECCQETTGEKVWEYNSFSQIRSSIAPWKPYQAGEGVVLGEKWYDVGHFAGGQNGPQSKVSQAITEST